MKPQPNPETRGSEGIIQTNSIAAEVRTGAPRENTIASD
jgi:hypothetical protein